MTKKFKKTALIISIVFALAILLSIAPMVFNNSEKAGITSADFQIPLKYTKPLVINFLDHSLSVQPINASGSSNRITDKKNSDIVKYTDAFQDTDIVLTKSTNKLKEDIILKQPGHPQEFRYSMNWMVCILDVTQ